MERLTKWNGKNWILPQGRTSDGQSYWRLIADKLAYYENAEEDGNWIDTRNCVPFTDGHYLVQTVYGDITGMSYTHAGGWNTRYTSDGELYDNAKIEDTYIARWYMHEKPKAVPKAWVDEHNEAYWKGVSECDTE